MTDNLQIVRTLEGDVSLLNDLKKGSTPGISGSGDSADGNIKKSKKSEVSSEEFTSGEHESTEKFVQSKGQP